MTTPTVTATGAIPTSPQALRDTLVANVAATNPNYTANLPGSLVEDIASTDVGAMVLIDQARVDAINSLTPYGANPFVLNQMGAQFGIKQGTPTNTNVLVVFTGLAGYVIPAGFLISDGTNQYSLQSGGVIETGGTSAPLYAVAVNSGSWTVPANSVTTIQTSVPSGYPLTVTNPSAGVPGSAAESLPSYQSRVIQAGISAGQATPNYIYSLLRSVAGTSQRLIRIIQTTLGWEVICGGGDPYAVANAIYTGTLELTSIVGSVNTARNINVTLTDYPNVYNIVYVNPPMQTVTISAIWNTTQPNFTAGQQVNNLAAPALANYINGIVVGQPINVLALNDAFLNAVSSVILPIYVTTLTFAITINGILTAPSAGTNIIPSDAESYFYCSPTGVTVAQ